MEIRKVLGLSTAHVKEETMRLLEREPETNTLGLTVYGFPYGSWVYTGNLEEENGGLTCYETPVQLPEDLTACILLAVRNGCSWLQFDCDADPVPELPWYDWG